MTMTLEPQLHGPITRLMLARYLVCSDDPNPVHVDEPFARSLGFPSVIAQGMVSYGWLAEMLTRAYGADNIRSLAARFSSPVFPGEEVTVGGTQTRRWVEGGSTFMELDVFADVAGSHRMTGIAVVEVEKDEVNMDKEVESA